MIFNTEEREAWEEFADKRRHSGLPPTNSFEAFVYGYRAAKLGTKPYQPTEPNTETGIQWINSKSGSELKNLLRYKGVPFYNTDSDAVLRIKYFEDVQGFQLVVVDKKDDDTEFTVDIDTHGHTFESAIEYVNKYWPFADIISVSKKLYKYNGGLK